MFKLSPTQLRTLRRMTTNKAGIEMGPSGYKGAGRDAARWWRTMGILRDLGLVEKLEDKGLVEKLEDKGGTHRITTEGRLAVATAVVEGRPKAFRLFCKTCQGYEGPICTPTADGKLKFTCPRCGKPMMRVELLRCVTDSTR